MTTLPDNAEPVIDPQRNLAHAMCGYQAAGWRVESQTNRVATLVKGNPIHDGVRPYRRRKTVSRRRVRLTVDQYGHVSVTRIK